MEKEIHEEEVKADLSLLPHKPYIWLMIREKVDVVGDVVDDDDVDDDVDDVDDDDDDNDNEHHIFYNIAEDRYYVRFVPELENKYVLCCYGGWLVLGDWCTNDCSILNILTMEKFHLPPLPQITNGYAHCVLSSSKMDNNCRVILFKRSFYINGFRKFQSCHIGDSEVIQGELIDEDGDIRDLINFKGKFYALTTPEFNLLASDFSDPSLRLEKVVSGQSVAKDVICTGSEEHIHLVESCEDLLLIFMSEYDYEIPDVKIFKADFRTAEWVKVDTLGDRTIFLGSVNKSFSSPASTFGLKSNVVYWVNVKSKYIYMYDIEDKSISMSMPVPIVETGFLSSWASFPVTCNEEKKLEQNDMSFLFEVSPIETNFHVKQGKATMKSKELQIEQRKPLRRLKREEETETVGKTTIFRKESLWEDLPNELLLEIFSYLFGGDKVAFRSVCRSWYSISPPRSSKIFDLLVKPSDCSSPFLMCPDNKIYHPIYDDLYSINSLDISGSKVRAARDGWLLMDNSSKKLFFYNPVTKEEINLPDIELPDCDVMFYYSVFFSAPPTSANCLVVVGAELGRGSAICYMKIEDEDWMYYEIFGGEFFCFSNCNPVAFKDQYYFLGDYDAKLLIFCPKKNEARVIEAPKFICKSMFNRGQQYMLESDGKLIAVFVSSDGSLVYPCEWNVLTSEWDLLVSLENIMLFVSRPLSLCKRATVRGTGNKIYFPRVVGEGHILFYSLATKRYHTFEMGTSYSNFFDSKFYPRHNGWFMP